MKNGEEITSTSAEQRLFPEGRRGRITTLYIVLLTGSVQFTSSSVDADVIDSDIETWSTSGDKILISVEKNESLRCLGDGTFVVTW